MRHYQSWSERESSRVFILALQQVLPIISTNSAVLNEILGNILNGQHQSSNCTNLAQYAMTTQGLKSEVKDRGDNRLFINMDNFMNVFQGVYLLMHSVTIPFFYFLTKTVSFNFTFLLSSSVYK